MLNKHTERKHSVRKYYRSSRMKKETVAQTCSASRTGDRRPLMSWPPTGRRNRNSFIKFRRTSSKGLPLK